MIDLSHRSLIAAAYAAFNARAIDAALVTMHADVDWPNGWEGGRVIGHQAIYDYWTRQWAVLNPHVEPLKCTTDETGQIVVDVHQVVSDQSGDIIVDEVLQHVYEIEDSLIKRMDIRKL